MTLALLAFFGIVLLEGRVEHPCSVGCDPKRPAKIGRPTLGEVVVGAFEFTGLKHRRVKSCIGNET